MKLVFKQTLLSLEHPVMSKQMVFLSKIIVFNWLLVGAVTFVPRVFMPMQFETYDFMIPYAWRVFEVLLGLSLGLLVLLTPYIRIACFLLSLKITLGIILSLPHYTENQLLFALVLLILSLIMNKTNSINKVLCWQFAILHLAAGLNKCLSSAWREGQVMRTLMLELKEIGFLWSPGPFQGMNNHIAIFLNDLFNEVGFLAVLLSVLVIFLELLIGMLYIFNSRKVLLYSFMLHGSIVLLTGGVFGVFSITCLIVPWVLFELPKFPENQINKIFIGCGVITIIVSGPWMHPWFIPVLLVLVVFYSLKKNEEEVQTEF